MLAAASLLTGSAILVVGAGVGTGIASASPVPPDQFTCGSTPVPTACNQTAHFSSIDQVGTPPPNPGPSCPSFLSDFVSIVGSGNGIEHSIVNKSGDGWFSTTFTGSNITFTAYPPSSVLVDSNGNATIVGPPDATVPVYTGKFTESFHGSFNRNNFVMQSTFDVSATAPDAPPVTLHSVSHQNTTPNTPPPPTGVPHSFAFTNC